MRTVIVIPTYNEYENLKPLIEQILALDFADLRIVIIDDNSPDGTGEVAQTLARTYSQIKVIHRQQRRGLASAYIAGFKYLLKEDVDYIVQMDADFSHHPKYILLFLNKIKECDMVIGSRYLSGSKQVKWASWRLAASYLASKYVRLCTGMPISDPLGGFKCFRKTILANIGLDRIISNGFVFQAEMTYRTYREGYRLTEIPIVFYPRRSGLSKISNWIAVEALIKLPFFRLIS